MRATFKAAKKVAPFLFTLAVLLAGGSGELQAQSALDGFDPNANSTVSVIVVQPDGKILIGGDFTTLSPNGGAAVTRNRIARLNPDGTLDTAFDPGASESVNAIALQTDGKILVGGGFTAIGGQTRNRIARLNPDGTLDTAFNPNASNSSVLSIAVQADGKVLVAGSFLNISGLPRNRIARLDAVTGLADSFDPNANSNVRSIAVQADGKILVGGDFSGENSIGGISGQTRNRIARLNPDGTLDGAFNPNASSIVRSIAIQADGKILAGGSFTTIGGQTRTCIARLEAVTGLADSFAPNANNPNANNSVRSIAVQADGKIVAGGDFSGANSIGGQTRNFIARLDPATGMADSFDPNANNLVFSVAVQADGKILAGGFLTALAPNGGVAVTRNFIARLETSTPTPTPTPSNTVQFSLATYEASEGSIGGVALGIGSGEVPEWEAVSAQLAGGALVQVTRAGDLSQPAEVDYSTQAGTASDRSDYTAIYGTLRFAPGQPAKLLVILITDDVHQEPVESFTVALSNPVGSALGATSSANVQITSDDPVTGPNPVKDPSFNSDHFVRYHYHDFLNRDADAAGLSFWKNQIDECETRPEAERQTCREMRRINVSASFFLSVEFQETGFLVYRLHQEAFNMQEGQQLPRFLADVQEIRSGIVVGQSGWEQQLEQNKQLFAERFVARTQFLASYPASMTPAQFVDALNVNTGGSLSQPERDALVAELTANNTNAGRAGVLRKIADDADFRAREFNRAFVLMQYFGYLRRNPNEAPDTNFNGFNFWLTKLNQFGGNFVNAEMVKAFIVSGEYGGRFGP